MSHPSEQELALHVGREAGFFAARRVNYHLQRCADCRRKYQSLEAARDTFRAQAGQMPVADWDRLAAEMTANIRLGLAAGQIVAAPRPAVGFASWRPAFVLAAALLVVFGAWMMHSEQNTSPVAAVPVPQVTVTMSAEGLELNDHGRVLTLRNPDGPVAFSASLQGAVRARYVDSETGQVTINNVYVQ